MPNYTEDIKNLVKERLMAIPSNITFSVGTFGDFTKDELIHAIDAGSEIGKGAIDMHLEFIRRMPTLLR